MLTYIYKMVGDPDKLIYYNVLQCHSHGAMVKSDAGKDQGDGLPVTFATSFLNIDYILSNSTRVISLCMEFVLS